MTVGAMLASGRTADVHEFGARRVIKIPRPAIPAHWAALEAQMSAAVNGHGLPAPEVLDVVTVDGRSCIVFERIDGPSMWQRMQESPDEIPELTAELVRVQRMIHVSGLPADVPDLVSRLQRKVSACTAIDADDQREAAMAVDRLPRGAALLHGDLHPGNVLLGPDGPVVIDWFDAAIGHPLGDVVRTSLLLRLGFEGVDQRTQTGHTRQLLRQVHVGYVDAWRSTVALDDSVFEQWEPVLALARISEEVDEEAAPLLELWRNRLALITAP